MFDSIFDPRLVLFRKDRVRHRYCKNELASNLTKLTSGNYTPNEEGALQNRVLELQTLSEHFTNLFDFYKESNKYLGFLLDGSCQMPEEFLCRDSTFYVAHVDENKFLSLRRWTNPNVEYRM